jgi:hypothetical protein
MMKRIAVLLLVLGCVTAFAVTRRIPQLIRLREDLRPIFSSLGVTNQPVIVGQGTILRGSYRDGQTDGFSILAPLLKDRPNEHDGRFPRLTQRTNTWIYASFIPVRTNAAILIRFEYGLDTDTNIVQRIKKVIETNRTTKSTLSTESAPSASPAER